MGTRRTGGAELCGRDWERIGGLVSTAASAIDERCHDGRHFNPAEHAACPREIEGKRIPCESKSDKCDNYCSENPEQGTSRCALVEHVFLAVAMARLLLCHPQDAFTRTWDDVLISFQNVGMRQWALKEFKTRSLNKTFTSDGSWLVLSFGDVSPSVPLTIGAVERLLPLGLGLPGGFLSHPQTEGQQPRCRCQSPSSPMPVRLHRHQEMGCIDTHQRHARSQRQTRILQETTGGSPQTGHICAIVDDVAPVSCQPPPRNSRPGYLTSPQYTVSVALSPRATHATARRASAPGG